jgi:cation transport ATPase-like protein
MPEPASLPEPAPATSHSAQYWASLPAAAVPDALGTTCAGIEPGEAAARLVQCGPNTLPRVARRLWYLDLAANFVHLFALLLWAGAALVLLLFLIYTPLLAAAFGLAPLGPWHWLMLATFGPVLLALEEIRKAAVRKTRRVS